MADDMGASESEDGGWDLLWERAGKVVSWVLLKKEND